MPRLVSQRKKVTPVAKLTDERWKFLDLEQAQPNLGFAPTNNEGYTLQTDGDGKQTFTNTLGKLSFANSTITNTQQADIVINNEGNGNIILSPQTKLFVTNSTEIDGSIVVKGDNPLGTFPTIDNVLYVNTNGDDANDGRAMDPSRAKRTITGAVQSPYYQEGTTIRVASGHYWEDNPIPLKASTCVIGDDLRTTFIEPLNKDVDLFWVNSGVYIAQMAMINLKKGSVTRYAPGGAGTYTTGAYCVAFPPSLTSPITVQYSPYIQNCTNQSGPWLFDGTMFRPNQTVQVPLGAGVSSWSQGVQTITVAMSTGSVAIGMAVNDTKNPGYANGYNLLVENIPFFQAEATAYISANFPDLSYDESKSIRDVSTIINAIGADGCYGGNLRSREAGAAFWSGSTSVLGDSQGACSAVLTYLGTLLDNVVTNTLNTGTYQNSTEQVIDLTMTDGGVIIPNMTTALEIVINLINGGLGSLPTPIDPDFGLITTSGLSSDDITRASTVTNITSTSTGLANAQTLLVANRSFIQNEVVAYVNQTYPTLQYNTELCFRDVGLILDAVSIDGIIGGNIQSVIAGSSYWVGNVSNIPNEVPQTVDAINRINTLAQQVITNTTVTQLSTATQYINNALSGGGDASAGIQASIDVITNIVTNGLLSTPESVYPSLDQYVITLNTSTVGSGTTSTIYFGYTTVYPVEDKNIPEEWILARGLDPHGSGGGALIDGNAPSLQSPIQSFVFDAFTQLNQGGYGIHVINNGYAQLVSVFTIFCDIGVLTENGGICSITNSNANFGNFALVSKGYGRLEFSGITWNPPYPTNVPNGQYYPLGYWPNNGQVEVYIPDLVNRPHIGLILEVVPPKTYIDYNGDRVPYINSAGYPGFLGASANTSTLTAGAYSIGSIDTDGIVVGHTLYITDIDGNTGVDGVLYVNTGTTVVDINFNSVTLDQPINISGGDSTNDLFYNLYFCGNAYYTVLSSSVDSTVPVTSTESFIPAETAETAEAIRYAAQVVQAVVTNTPLENPYQTGTIQTINLSYTNGANAEPALTNNFNIIANIIENGQIAAPTVIQNSSLKSQDQGIINAAKLMDVNKQFIQEEVTAYVDKELFGFNYDHDKCYRDTGLIVDAVAFDTLYGGYSQSGFAGLQYWAQTGYTGNIPKEITTTTNAINYVNQLAQDILQNITTGTRYQNIVTQITGTIATTATISTVVDDFNFVTQILSSGTAGVTDLIVPNGLASTSTDIINAFNLLQTNKAYLQAEAIAFVNSTTTSTFTYDSVKCSRDSGLIVDAIVLDLLYPTTYNSQSTFAGIQYWNQASYTGQIAEELTTTTNAITYAKELAQKVIVNDITGTRYQNTVTQVTDLVPGTAAEATTVGTDFDVILNILANGTAGITDQIVPNNADPSTENNINNAYALLQANRNYIQSEVIAYVESNKTTGFTYSQSLCFRDTGYMIDSVSFDLLHSGNRQAIQSGVSYYSYTNVSAIPNEQSQTVDAFNFIASVAQILVEGGEYTPLQTSVLPVTDLTTSTVAQGANIASIVNTVTNIIINGFSTSTVILTPISLTRTTDLTAEAAAEILGANRAFIQAETIAWVNQAFNFTYDQTTCSRDVGYILDSVCFDLLHGGNKQSIQSGLAYYNYANTLTDSVIEGQRVESQYAYQHISNMLNQILAGNLVTPTYQTTATQATGTVTVSLAEIVTVQDKINTITNIIAYGPSVAPEKSPISLTASTSTDDINAFNAILANRAFIQAEVTAYIDATFSSFQYNSITCARDTGLIVDSIAVDLLYPGSSQSTFAALQYWNQDGYTGAIARELTTTTAAINYVSQLAQQVITNSTGTRYQNTVSQVTNIPAGSSGAVATIANEFNIITNILSSGTSGITDTIVPNGSVSSDTGIQHAYALLQANKSYIQAEAIAFVEATKSGAFEYNVDNCYRDTGLIVDSLAFDLLYGGTSQSTFAALQYWSQTTTTNAIIPGELTTTTNAITYAQGLVAAFANTAGGTVPEGIVNDNFNTILTILSTGTVGVTDLIVPNGYATTASNIISAYNAIVNNIATIQNMTISYINSSNPGFTYNTSTCIRDLGFIINSVAFDLLHGGNRQSVMSAVYYYGYNTATVLINEMSQAIAAYSYINELVENIVTGTLITTNRQTEVAQVTSLAFSYDQTKCYRDTGLIVDSIGLDLLYPTPYNSQATFTGLQYWNQSGYTGFISTELTTTTNAINYLKTLAQQVMVDDTTGARYQNTLSQYTTSTIASSLETSYVAGEFNTILNIINSGTAGVTDLIVPNGIASSTSTTIAGYNLLQANRSYLQAEVVAYVNATKSPNFMYDQAICGRDVGYMIDSISFDLLHGGNRQAIQSGVYYYDFNGSSSAIPNEIPETTAAYNHLREVIAGIVQNQAITPSLSNTGTQVFESYTATLVEATELQSYVDTIVNIISNGPQAVVGGATPISLTVNSSTTATYAYNLLQANRTFIQQEIVAFVNDTFVSTSKDTAGVGTATDVQTISSSISLITDIIANGPSVAPAKVPIGQTASSNSSTVSAFNLLLKNREFIRAEVLAYVDQEFASGPYYNRDTCRRDTRLIIDALAQDLLFDGSSQSNFAGLQYWTQTDNGYTGAIASEITTTTNAVNYISALAQKVVLGDTTGDRFQTLITQNTAFPTATQEEATLIAADFAVITNILTNGIDGVTDAIIPNGLTASTNTNVQNAYALLEANKAFLQAEAIAFVEDTKTSGFTYNSDTCYRDVGYMVDSISFDLLYGGNRQAIQSGVAYYAYDSSSSVIENEQTVTTAAYDRIKEMIPYIVTGQLVTTAYQNHTKQVISTSVGTTAEATAMGANIDLITGIINGGPSAANPKTPIGLIRSTDINVINASTLLEANKEFIVEEVIAYINSTFSGFQYNQATCYRDVGYMIDSVSFDLLHGGNRQAVQSGAYYYNFNASSSAVATEIPQVTAAYTFINSLMNEVITANTVTNVYQTATIQVTNLPGTSSSAVETSINDNISLINSIISSGPSVAPAKVPVPLTASSDPDAVKAYNLLAANREFIVAETIAYINDTFVKFNYDRNKCYRDVGSILDAVIYDVLYTGNYRSVNTGNGYYARKGRYHVITLEENVTDPGLFIDGCTVNFYQRSYQSASGYLFEYIGAGANYSALPQIGRKDPIQAHETVQLNNGKVFFTSTDQNGDFRIGPGLVISQATGVLYGRTFQKSLYAEMTPFILVVGGQ